MTIIGMYRFLAALWCTYVQVYILSFLIVCEIKQFFIFSAEGLRTTALSREQCKI